MLDREPDGVEHDEVLGFEDAHAHELARREATLASVLDDDQVVPQAKLNRVAEKAVAEERVIREHWRIRNRSRLSFTMR
jgi:hypothetical protein